jgi:dTDP-4-dehydrorhamnose reductase
MLLDVEDLPALTSAVASFAPEIVINCVGTLVKESAQKPGTAAFVNGYFPHFLERLGVVKNFRLIHLSTDCVFSGAKGAYMESDVRDGKDFYSQSKAMGEVVNSRDLTVRTSIVGPELKKNATGLFHWLMTSRGPVNGYDRVYWNGVTTLHLAKAIDAFICADTTGVCHLATPGRISKYDLIVLMRDIWARTGLTISRESGPVSDKTLVSTRPDLPFVPPDYKVQFEELKSWMRANERIYLQYL